MLHRCSGSSPPVEAPLEPGEDVVVLVKGEVILVKEKTDQREDAGRDQHGFFCPFALSPQGQTAQDQQEQKRGERGEKHTVEGFDDPATAHGKRLPSSMVPVYKTGAPDAMVFVKRQRVRNCQPGRMDVQYSRTYRGEASV